MRWYLPQESLTASDLLTDSRGIPPTLLPISQCRRWVGSSAVHHPPSAATASPASFRRRTTSAGGSGGSHVRLSERSERLSSRARAAEDLTCRHSSLKR